MMKLHSTSLALSVDPAAFARCFIVADILEARYDEPSLEYGMLGVAVATSPLHVVATPLLPGQKVTGGSVHLSGRDVFRLRAEVEEMSRRMEEPLVPICFIHRHPGACGLSGIDRDFVTGTFIDQVATVVIFEETRQMRPGSGPRDCCSFQRPDHTTSDLAPDTMRVQIDYSLCFSLIVNQKREYSIDAVRKEWCPFCERPHVCFETAALMLDPNRLLPPSEIEALHHQLEEEIADKIFPRTNFLRVGGTS